MTERPTVTIAYVCREIVTHSFHRSMCDLLLATKATVNCISRDDSALVGWMRESVVQEFLEGDTEWLLFLDTDMQFPPYVLDHLLAAAGTERPIIGGMYFLSIGNGVIAPVAIERLPNKALDYMWNYPQNQVVEVAAAGTGCLLIRRDVLVALRDAFADRAIRFFPSDETDEISGSPSPIAECVGFSLRAAGLGFPTYIHTGLHLGHVKPFVIDVRAYARAGDGQRG